MSSLVVYFNNENEPGDTGYFQSCTNDDKSSGIQIMGKAKRIKRLRKEKKSFEETFSDGFTRNFIKEIKNSSIWEEMVAEYGEKRAIELLKDCKAEIKSGLPPGME